MGGSVTNPGALVLLQEVLSFLSCMPANLRPVTDIQGG